MPYYLVLPGHKGENRACNAPASLYQEEVSRRRQWGRCGPYGNWKGDVLETFSVWWRTASCCTITTGWKSSTFNWHIKLISRFLGWCTLGRVCSGGGCHPCIVKCSSANWLIPSINAVAVRMGKKGKQSRLESSWGSSWWERQWMLVYKEMEVCQP